VPATVRKLLLLVAAALGSGLVASACNPATPYAAVVNGKVIPASDLNFEMSSIAGNPTDVASIRSATSANGSALEIRGQAAGTYGTTFASEVLRQEILYQLIGAELAHRHAQVTPYELTAAKADVPAALQGSGQTAVDLNLFPKAYQQILIRRQAELEALEATLAGQSLTAETVSRYYSSHSSIFFEACASRIEVANPLAALAVESDLAKGVAFATEAGSKSTDTQTASQGGVLGCGTGLQFQSSFGSGFAGAVAGTALNTPSAPVTVPNGYDVIEVTRRQALPVSAAYSQIRQELTNAGGTALESLLTRDVGQAAVTVDARYGTWSASAVNGVSGVIPPSPPQAHSDLTG
jgi:parvulin-like peptidyl-prolyl isomerase